MSESGSDRDLEVLWRWGRPVRWEKDDWEGVRRLITSMGTKYADGADNGRDSR